MSRDNDISSFFSLILVKRPRNNFLRKSTKGLDGTTMLDKKTTMVFLSGYRMLRPNIFRTPTQSTSHIKDNIFLRTCKPQSPEKAFKTLDFFPIPLLKNLTDKLASLMKNTRHQYWSSKTSANRTTWYLDRYCQRHYRPCCCLLLPNNHHNFFLTLATDPLFM